MDDDAGFCFRETWLSWMHGGVWAWIPQHLHLMHPIPCMMKHHQITPVEIGIRSDFSWEQKKVLGCSRVHEWGIAWVDSANFHHLRNEDTNSHCTTNSSDGVIVRTAVIYQVRNWLIPKV